MSIEHIGVLRSWFSAIPFLTEIVQICSAFSFVLQNLFVIQTFIMKPLFDTFQNVVSVSEFSIAKIVPWWVVVGFRGFLIVVYRKKRGGLW